MDAPTRYSSSATVHISAPVTTVWRALVEPEAVAQYFHGTSLTADWHVGGRITWSGEWKGNAYVDEGEVLEYDPPHSLSYSHWSPLSGTENASDTRHVISYGLAADGEGTVLTLTQQQSLPGGGGLDGPGWMDPDA